MIAKFSFLNTKSGFPKTDRCRRKALDAVLMKQPHGQNLRFFVPRPQMRDITLERFSGVKNIIHRFLSRS